MSDSVLMNVEDGVLTVTLNEPDSMNALSAGVTQGIFDAIAHANESDDVRVMVLTGAGRGFCAGAAIGASGGVGGGGGSRRSRLDQRGSSARTVEAFADCEVPVIGAINGAAAGAGFGIALCCDVRILAASARMGTIFIKRGLGTDYGVGYWLPKIVGIGHALDLIYTGDLIDAERCLAIGLANRVVPDEELMTEAGNYAKVIAEGPPLAYTMTRRMAQRSLYMTPADYLEYEWTNQKVLLGSKDVAEGFQSFRERRAPEFKGE